MRIREIFTFSYPNCYDNHFLFQKGKVDKDKESSKRVKDKESGVARGIDFQFVANVINFDFPKVQYRMPGTFS